LPSTRSKSFSIRFSCSVARPSNEQHQAQGLCQLDVRALGRRCGSPARTGLLVEHVECLGACLARLLGHGHHAARGVDRLVDGGVRLLPQAARRSSIEFLKVWRRRGAARSRGHGGGGLHGKAIAGIFVLSARLVNGINAPAGRRTLLPMCNTCGAAIRVNRVDGASVERSLSSMVSVALLAQQDTMRCRSYSKRWFSGSVQATMSRRVVCVRRRRERRRVCACNSLPMTSSGCWLSSRSIERRMRIERDSSNAMHDMDRL